MIQNKMVQPGTRRHQEQKNELVRKIQGSIMKKTEETGDFSSIYPHKMVITVAEKK
jgi:hypothetical protein